VTDDTALHRQVHPNFIQNGRVTSQAFHPTPKDEYMLSVYDGDLISAEASWKHYLSRGLASAGVLDVTVRECAAEALPVDPSPEDFAEHVVVDFRNLTKAQIKGKATRLTVAAVQRGWQYQG
jgi:hypothetical protein